MVYCTDYEQKPSTDKFIDYSDSDVKTDCFKCKSCHGIFIYQGVLNNLKDRNKNTRKLRINLLNQGICLHCSGRITKKHFHTRLKYKWKDDDFIDNFRKKISGPKHHNWKGGITFEPYCYLFNESFKERVRNFWNNKCGICGKLEINDKRKLCVHHVNYDKDTCCNNNKPLFIPLCGSCHAKTNYNRDSWEEILSNFIMIYFDGESFE